MKYSILLLMLVLATPGCVRNNTGNNLPTFANQIADLVDAHQSGVISTEEYTRLRRRMMKTMLR